MNKHLSCFVGVDVSKDTFNAHFQGLDFGCKNNLTGWRAFYKELPVGATIAMEATGNYHLDLADYFYKKGFRILVFNPQRAKNYIRSLGLKNETDKIDARALASYSELSQFQDCEYTPMSSGQRRMRAIVTLLFGLAKLSISAHNRNHHLFYAVGRKRGDSLLRCMSNIKAACSQERERLEAELCDLVNEVYPDKFALLQTIPGIGAYTAALLLATTRGMTDFASRSKLASFIGLTPSSKQSGTSVNSRGKIRKVGNSYLRACLLMCAWTAVRYNKPCTELQARLVARGKSELLANVAVMHRLIRIAFGVIRSGKAYRSGRNYPTK